MNPEPNTTPKKPRSDAKLLNLPEAQAAQLRDLLFEGASCTEAVEFIQTNFGITTGRSAVSAFWRQQCVPLLPERREKSFQIARIFAAPDHTPPAVPFDQAAQSFLEQRIFDLCLTPSPDIAEIKDISAILHRNRSLALAESRLDIARARAALEERRVASREADATQTRNVKQAEVDREDKERRDWDSVWGFLRPKAPAPAPASPQAQGSNPATSATPAAASPDALP